MRTPFHAIQPGEVKPRRSSKEMALEQLFFLGSIRTQPGADRSDEIKPPLLGKQDRTVEHPSVEMDSEDECPNAIIRSGCAVKRSRTKESGRTLGCPAASERIETSLGHPAVVDAGLLRSVNPPSDDPVQCRNKVVIVGSRRLYVGRITFGTSQAANTIAG